MGLLAGAANLTDLGIISLLLAVFLLLAGVVFFKADSGRVGELLRFSGVEDLLRLEGTDAVASGVAVGEWLRFFPFVGGIESRYVRNALS